MNAQESGTLFASNTGEDIDVGHYFRLLLSNKWKIILFVALLVAIAVVYVKPLRAIYQAETVVLIETGQNAFTGEDVFGDSSAGGYLATQYGILRSRAFVEKVVDRLDLTKHPEYDPDQSVEEKNLFQVLLEKVIPEEQEEVVELSEEEVLLNQEFIRNLTVSRIISSLIVVPEDGTQLVKIQIQAHDPLLAADIVNELAEVYVESYLEARLVAAKKSASWLSGRLNELQDNLQLAENELLAYRESESLVDVEGITTLDAAELTQLRTNYVNLRQERINAEALFEEVSQYTSESILDVLNVPFVAENQSVELLVLEKNQSDKNLKDLGRRYGAKHPLIVAAVGEQKKTEQNLINRLNVLTKGIQESYEKALLKEKEVSNQVGALEDRLQDLGRKEVKLRELERRVEASRQVYELFLSRGKEADETVKFERPPARVIDVALPPKLPIGPEKAKYVIAAAVFAFGFIAAILIGLDLLDSTIRVPEEVESQLAVPLLGFLPLVKGKAGRDFIRSFSDDYSGDGGFSESIRTIRTSLVLSNLENPIKSIAITSSLPDEGKSTLAVNMAEAFSQMEKVLLIDADMRRPSIGKVLGFSESKVGLSDVIDGKVSVDDAISSVEGSNLEVLLAGDVPERPLELISHGNFKELMSELELKYDRIIVDTPPAYIVSDSKILSKFSDALVYVVKANSTTKSVISKSISSLKRLKAPILGVVLNQVDYKKASVYEPDYGVYGKKYGYSEYIQKAS